MIDSRVSHYRLIRKLGAGTFGEVYEGVHVHDEQLRVAVKIVSPLLAQDASFVDALKSECRQLDKLDHPNIVRFRDLVVNDGQVAMVLELLAGQDLHARLAAGPIPPDTAVSVLEAMLEGLAHAHARGVLHRDIKPGNVYWCDDGRVKLLDFGIARAADGTQATKTGHMVGTFDYMAPERFDGQHGSAASDVYAAGLIAWELLTGGVACPEGEPGRKMKWHMMRGVGNASAVQTAVPSCPAWLAEVVATLAATEMSERPADGGAALALLRAKRAGEVEPQAPAPAPRRAPPSTVMGPVSAPPVSAPPVRVLPSSSPPGTVMGPAAVAQRSEPPETRAAPAPASSESAAPNPSAAPGAASKMPLLVGGAVAVVLTVGGYFALRGPSAASIELAPEGDVFLVVGSDATAPTARALDAQGNVVSGVQMVCTSDTPAVRLRDGKLSASEAAKATVTCAAGGAEARFSVNAVSTYTSATTGYELRPIPGGTFSMGSPAREANRSENETQHKVTLTRAYWMGTTEVTQAQWETVMGSNPSEKEYRSVSFLNPSYPVQNVSWCDAVVFANKLSEKEGLTSVYTLPGGMSAGLEYGACNDLAPKVTMTAGADGYRLPTEAEWERAARGGTTDTYAGTNREADLCGVANVRDASAKARFDFGGGTACDDHHAGLAAVGSYTANAYGLKDMSGNVWEWNWDTFGAYPAGSSADPTGATEGPGRVGRGGSWSSAAGSARAAYRRGDRPGNRNVNLGFRLSRTIP